MTNQPEKSSDEESNKTLVRVLVIVGIGIPVLVELLTLFNLINVQLFEDEKVVKQHAQPVEVQEYMIGDTLFADTAVPITIADMLIKVSTQSWKFELALSRSRRIASAGSSVAIDSLKLKSGEVLSDAQKWKMDKASKADTTTFNWLLPSGDMPTMLYMSAQQSLPKDSTNNLQQQVQLGKIPVRYSQDSD
ncbi:hypothetical protein LX73_1791 [Fodinibius salinus]|uniref:Uncharacterized protein n=1 Tax=Fodinibius salinus TaxID=860790 RepID=A0A5D3YMX2_9BACT|nr:hypothetical protein [Fodinibius salinus]TYP94067.1 hypothetical protein LX73_1791 [Fodinibius salinus]